MRLTLVHPSIGRRVGERYIRSWQMEPLPPATLAGLTPDDIEVRFYDDRMEAIPYDEPTDLVALSVETYTAKRAYQIASEDRRRGIPVVMGGLHATLCPDEVAQFAEIVVVGEAESVWAQLVDDDREDILVALMAAQIGRVRRAGLDYVVAALSGSSRVSAGGAADVAASSVFQRALRRLLMRSSRSFAGCGLERTTC